MMEYVQNSKLKPFICSFPHCLPTCKMIVWTKCLPPAVVQSANGSETVPSGVITPLEAKVTLNYEGEQLKHEYKKDSKWILNKESFTSDHFKANQLSILITDAAASLPALFLFCIASADETDSQVSVYPTIIWFDPNSLSTGLTHHESLYVDPGLLWLDTFWKYKRYASVPWLIKSAIIAYICS